MDKGRKKRKRSSQKCTPPPKARVIVILIGEEKDGDAVWVQNLKYELELLISPNFTIRIVSVERMSISAAKCRRRLALCYKSCA